MLLLLFFVISCSFLLFVVSFGLLFLTYFQRSCTFCITLWPQWQDKQWLDHQPRSVNCSVIKHRDDIIMRWNISQAQALSARSHIPVTSPWPLFCIFIDGVISLTCTQGNQGDNLKCSSVPVFIWAAAWGWVLGRRAGEPGLNWVCAYMIYVAYTQTVERETTFPPYMLERTRLLHLRWFYTRNVLLQHTSWEMYCFKDSIGVSLL